MWRAFIRGGDIVISLGHRRALFGNAAFDARREACETVGEAFEAPRVPFTRLVRSLTNLDEPLATSRASFAAARVAFARTQSECVHTRDDAACTQLEEPRPHLETVRTSLEAARANADDAHRSGRLRAHSVPRSRERIHTCSFGRAGQGPAIKVRASRWIAHRVAEYPVADHQLRPRCRGGASDRVAHLHVDSHSRLSRAHAQRLGSATGSGRKRE